jgi:hypothetical protein
LAKYLRVFEDELHQLHKNGFVHRDLRRPSDMPFVQQELVELEQFRSFFLS